MPTYYRGTSVRPAWALEYADETTSKVSEVNPYEGGDIIIVTNPKHRQYNQRGRVKGLVGSLVYVDFTDEIACLLQLSEVRRAVTSLTDHCKGCIFLTIKKKIIKCEEKHFPGWNKCENKVSKVIDL